MRLTTRPLLFAPVLALALAACASSDSSDGDDDYSDATWEALSDDGASAVDEGDVADEDASEASDDIDDSADPAEPDDDDPTAVDPPSLGASSEDADAVDLHGLAVAPGSGGALYKNPVAPNCADPGVVRAGETFYVACTGNGFGRMKSSDLVHWAADGHLFGAKTKPKWGGGDWWAPEVHHVGDGFMAYFAALSPRRHRICIGAARGDAAGGGFHDIGRPLACNRHVSLIDPHLFTDANGKHYLYWKTDGNGLRPKEKTVLYGRELAADGVHFVGKRHRLIRNTERWEGDVVEAPWVVHHGSYYYLFYSGFRYCDHTYGVGVARSHSPLGPFKKRSGPILRSNATWVGPGHNSIARAGDHDWIVYHAWHGAHSCGDTGSRELLIDRVRWVGGWPAINDGTPSRASHPAPTL
jgi:beta-xylosidase